MEAPCQCRLPTGRGQQLVIASQIHIYHGLQAEFSFYPEPPRSSVGDGTGGVRKIIIHGIGKGFGILGRDETPSRAVHHQLAISSDTRGHDRTSASHGL